MGLSKNKIFFGFIGFLFIQSAFIGVIFPHTGDTDYNKKAEYRDQQNESSFATQNRPKASQLSGELENEKLFWWIHITDVHIEMDQERRLENFDAFCNETVNLVNPKFVLSTGDMVDGGIIGNTNQVGHDANEFIFFNQTLEKYGYNQSFWYDVMGNHEQYNQLNSTSSYQQYLRPGPTNYDFTVNTSFGKYRIVGIDTTQHIGLKNFLNLFGEAKKDKLNEIEALVNSRNPAEYNHTILMGHHPLHQIMSEKSSTGKTLKDLVKEADTSLFLNGHVHRQGLHNHGNMIELMGSSFKETFEYRICALDNDLFSFSEQRFDQWPAAIVTNPMDGRLISEQYPVEIMEELPEIRTLIFDENPITSAYVLIDGKQMGNLTLKQGNLWTLEWDPTTYLQGKHELKIIVESSSGNATQIVPFVIGTSKPISYYSVTQMALAIPFYPLAIGILTVCFCLAFFRVIVPKLWAKNQAELPKKYGAHPRRKDFKGVKKRLFKQKFIKGAYLSKKISFALLVIPIYLLFGPAVIANFWLDRIGGIFISGILIGGQRVISLYSLLIIGLYLITAMNLQSYAILSYKDPGNRKGKLNLFLTLGGFFASLFLVSHYYGYLALLYNPINWIFGIVLIVAIKEVRKSHKEVDEIN